MADEELTTPRMPTVQRDAVGEMRACVWLIEQGYEVFRNVSHWGPIDLIATRGDEILFLDLKHQPHDYQPKASVEQKKRGVKFLLVNQKTGKCKIVEPAIPLEDFISSLTPYPEPAKAKLAPSTPITDRRRREHHEQRARRHARIRDEIARERAAGLDPWAELARRTWE